MFRRFQRARVQPERMPGADFIFFWSGQYARGASRMIPAKVPEQFGAVDDAGSPEKKDFGCRVRAGGVPPLRAHFGQVGVELRQF